MNALLFHPDQELLFIRQQKRILSELNKDSVRFYPFYPVYCPLCSKIFQTCPPAEIKKMIASVSVKNCVVTEKSLVFPVEILLRDGNVVSEQITAGIQTADGGTELDTDFFPFRMECRIFRIARIETDGFTTAFYDTVWVKNKK